MAQFLNKLEGRKYSADPAKGILIAKEILDSKNSHKDDVFYAICYLGYRTLDETYNDVDFIWPKILNGIEFAKQSSKSNKTETSIRWEISFMILYVYFKLNILSEKQIPVDVLNKIIFENSVQHCPTQLVNISRACSILSSHYLFSKNKKEFEKSIDCGINLYQDGIKSYHISSQNYNSIIWEWYESADALSVIRELKIFHDSDGKLITSNKLLKKWNSQIHHPSLGPFYKSLISVYNINNAV